MTQVVVVTKARLDLKIFGKASIRQVAITSEENKRDFKIQKYAETAMDIGNVRSHLFLQTGSLAQQSKA